jgi:hypothetical protein
MKSLESELHNIGRVVGSPESQLPLGRGRCKTQQGVSSSTGEKVGGPVIFVGMAKPASPEVVRFSAHFLVT